MRFLAYGGTAYLERRRIGDWRELPEEGTFSSLYGLRGGKIVYGVGLIDNLPTLIFKRLTAWNTRSYSYTILLDPGEKVWKTFEWNFARLFIAILKEPRLQNLFNKPEAVNEREVDQILNDLTPSITTTQQNKDETENIQNLWTYFAVKGEKFAFSPAKYGLTAVPNLPEMIQILSRIPQPLRIGYGWLLNGNAINAEEFKAKFVLDDDEATLSKEINTDELKTYIAQGKKYREAWNMIWDKGIAETDSETNEINQIRELSETPIHLWQEKLKFNCEILFSRIGLLAKINKYRKSIETLQIDDETELFDQIKQIDIEPQPLGTEIKQAIFDLAYKCEQKFDKVGTKYFLEQHFRKNYIDAILTPRLHQQTVIDELLERNTTPTEINLAVNSDLRTQFWQRKFELAAEKGNLEKIPKYLQDALNDLVPNNGLDTQDANLIATVLRPGLFDYAIKLAIKEMSLTDLAGIAKRYQIPLDSIRLNLFKDEAQRAIIDENLQSHNLSSVEGYLYFAGDKQGDFLSANITNGERLDKIIKEIIRLAKCNDNTSKIAQQWLDNIASSDLRKQIKIKTKIDINAIVELENIKLQSWNNFRILYRLAIDKFTIDEIRKIKQLSGNEIPILSQELNEIIPNLDFSKLTPNLFGLIYFFSDGKSYSTGKNFIGENTLEKLRQAKPLLTIREFDTWIEGWNIIGERNHAEKEIIRFALEHNPKDENHYKTVSNRISEEHFSDENLKRFCQKLLVKDDNSSYPSKNKHRVCLFIDYCQKINDKHMSWKKWQEIIDEVLANVNKEEKSVLYKRFTANQDYYNKWCESLPEKFHQALLEIFYEASKTKFLGFAENVHKFLSNDKAWWAIVVFMKDKKNDRVHSALARNLNFDWATEIARVEALVKKAKAKRQSQEAVKSSKVKVNAKNPEEPKGLWQNIKSVFKS